MRSLEGQIQRVTVHGHERAFLKVGKGPALLLLHGLGGNLMTWDQVIPELSQHFTVIAPDLLGHGRSAKPRADYSLGGYANGMRDLLSVLGISRVTVVGHSFGGGVAMQFTYQFPHLVERVVLVGTGGLGPEVSPLLRLLSVPGSGYVLSAVTVPVVRQVANAAGRFVMSIPLVGDGRLFPPLRNVPELLQGLDALGTPEGRSAFLHVLRAAIDPGGQVVTMLDRAYLCEGLPVLLVWGGSDSVIPVSHGKTGSSVIASSRLVVFPGAGHFPHRTRSEKFVEAVVEFVADTEPARFDRKRFKALLRSGGRAAAAVA